MAADSTGAMAETTCRELATGRLVKVPRNEDGVRATVSRDSLLGPSPVLEIVSSGDSHTDLCAEHDSTHFGYTATYLRELGLPARAYANGSGKYSPLQAYLAIEPLLSRYAPQVFVLNLYTGNDFYDMLRSDDRPSLSGRAGRYDFAPPMWYTYDPPGQPPKSPLLSAAKQAMGSLGVERVAQRVRYLRDVANEQQQGLGVVWNYMNDLRRSADPTLGYPQAYTAQMLNQQLFFHHFPGSREESLARVRYLLQWIKQQHPELTLVLSPIPSYQLVVATPTNKGMLEVLSRLPITYQGGVAEEEGLYGALRGIAAETGWTFVDNLPALRAVPTPDSLYNHFDYHIEPSASAIIGRNQAQAIVALRAPKAR